MSDENALLRCATPIEWLEIVRGDFGAFLQDHASCERKACALAMAFVGRHPDKPALVEAMIVLAREELEHFHQVFRLLDRRGLQLRDDEPDPYVNTLLGQARHTREERFLDRLLVSAMIELRGTERFRLLANHAPEASLRGFYRRLAYAEANHYKVFLQLARTYFAAEAVDAALDRFLDFEAQAIAAVPLRAAMH